MTPSPLFWALIGYLLGSIPFGLLLSRAAGTDLRRIGSGNIGATNVLRSGRRDLAAATLLLDGGKGAAAVLLARHFGDYDIQTPSSIIAGFAAFGGHLYPVWLRFKGGKGVATMLGVTLAAYWPAGICALLLWLTGAGITRYSSVGGLAASLALPVAVTWYVLSSPVFAYFGGSDTAVWLIASWSMALLIFIKHAPNLTRLRTGTEPRIGAR